MWVAFLVVLLGSGGLIVVGWLWLLERLPRQHWAGIRTHYSLANDEQWNAVHRFGAPYLVLGGAAAFAGALALLPFAIAGSLPTSFALASLAAFVLLVGISALLWRNGTRGAKAHLAGAVSR